VIITLNGSKANSFFMREKLTSDRQLCIKGVWLSKPDFFKMPGYNYLAFLRNDIDLAKKRLTGKQITGEILIVNTNSDKPEKLPQRHKDTNNTC
jgi:hypothetical protein